MLQCIVTFLLEGFGCLPKLIAQEKVWAQKRNSEIHNSDVLKANKIPTRGNQDKAVGLKIWLPNSGFKDLGSKLCKGSKLNSTPPPNWDHHWHKSDILKTCLQIYSKSINMLGQAPPTLSNTPPPTLSDEIYPKSMLAQIKYIPNLFCSHMKYNPRGWGASFIPPAPSQQNWPWAICVGGMP
jgi:hypothetical protein